MEEGRSRRRSTPRHTPPGPVAAVKEPSPIQTVTVGPGVSPDLQIAPLAGFTAGGDFHPALKVSKVPLWATA